MTNKKFKNFKKEKKSTDNLVFHYKGYEGYAWYEEEDDSYHGELVGIGGCVGFSGRTEDETYQDFIQAVKDWEEAIYDDDDDDDEEDEDDEDDDGWE